MKRAKYSILKEQNQMPKTHQSLELIVLSIFPYPVPLVHLIKKKQVKKKCMAIPSSFSNSFPLHFLLHVSKQGFYFILFLFFIKLSNALSLLDRCNPVDASEALDTLLIYMDNIINNPNETRFRCIRTSNTNYQERLGHLNGSF